MATERLIIEVSTKGTRVVRRDLKGIGDRAKASQRGVLGLGRALTLLGGLALARSILKTADSFQQLQNRLRIVTEGTGQLAAVTKELFEISNETRTAVAANAELFTRLSLATRELGLSQRELLDVTKSINQALIISGASAQEANAGLIQLSQGLASGVLRGDELRSVLEQLPAVADVIATELKVVRGELRGLGAQGKITAEVITRAFRNNREVLEELFARTIPTLAQSFTILNNKIVELVSELEKTRGPLAALSKAVFFLSNNIETFARVILGVVLVVGVQAAIKALIALNVVLVTNPFGILLTAVALAVGLLVTFADKIKASSDGLVTLADIATELGTVLSASFKQAVEQIKETVALFGDIGKELSEIKLSFETVVRAIAVSLDIIKNVFGGLFAAILLVFEKFPRAFGDVFISGVNAAIGAIDSLLRKTQLGLNLLLEQAEKAISAISGLDPPDLGRVVFPSLGTIANEFKSEAEQLKGAIEEIFKNVLVVDLDQGLSKVIDEAFERLRTRAREREEERTGVLGEPDDAKEVLGIFGELAKTFKGIDLSVKELAKTINTILVNAINSASEALADFALSGFQDIDSLRQAFSDLFAQLAKDIIAFTIRLLILKAIQASIAGFQNFTAAPNVQAGSPGLGSGALGDIPLQLQAGGPVRRGQPVIVGERETELFVPPSNGNIVPGGQFGQPDVNVTIVNVDDPNGVVAAVESAEGQQAILNVIQKNRTELRNVLA